MKTRNWLVVLLAAVFLSSSAAWADGDFYVVVAGGGVGTKITTLPLEIKTPGFYYLTGNLTYPGTGNGITVLADDVTIDLMGFRIQGPGSNGSNRGIFINCTSSTRQNVEVRNGTLSGWYIGLDDFGPYHDSLRSRALNLRIGNCPFGIFFCHFGAGYLVKGCTVEAATTGITVDGGVASGNIVRNCTNFGISGFGTIRDNFAQNCKIGISSDHGGSSIIGNSIITTANDQFGIVTHWVSDPCLVTQNTVTGPGTHFQPGSGTVNVANTNAGF